jgi:sugar O-acyltransferase (sialic acid O-acetyltransferase NeuD family)
MHNVIIVGAGGLGREVYSQLIGDHSHLKQWRVDSFIDDIYEGAPIHVANDINVSGKIENHIPADRNRYVMAIANPKAKEKIAYSLLERGAEFIPIITKITTGYNVKLSDTFCGFDVRIANNVSFGRCCYVDSENIISHDVTVGDFCHLGPRNFIAGGVVIGAKVIMHGGACVARGVSIGESAEIGLGSVVLRDVPSNALVLGNPARIISINKNK